MGNEPNPDNSVQESDASGAGIAQVKDKAHGLRIPLSGTSNEPSHERFWSFSRRTILLTGALLSVVILVVYFVWPRTHKKAVAVETPPGLQRKQAGEENREHTDGGGQESTIEVSDETAQLVGISTEKAVRGEIEETIATIGKVKTAPDSQAVVGAKVDGRAVRVMAEPGQQVRAGQVLIVVDSPQIADLRGQLSEARVRMKLAEQKRERAARGESRSAIIQSKNRLDLAEATLERKRRLLDMGAVAKKEVAEAETEYKNAKAEYEFQTTIQYAREQQEALSELEQTHAVVLRLSQALAAMGASADGQGGLINITSPLAGTVVDRHISIGQALTAGSELMTVMNLARVVIEAQVPESQAGRVKVGQRLVARIPAEQDSSFEGRVESVGNTVDPAKRVVAVRARVTNVGTHLRHEMAVEVRIVTGVGKKAILAPVSAIVDDEGIKLVYVKEGTRYERRMVAIGMTNLQSAEILRGVEAGEEVVTKGAYQLKNLQKGGRAEGEHDDEH